MSEAIGRQQPRFRAKYVVFAFIAAMTAYVLYNERFLIDPTHPIWLHYERSSGGCCRMASPAPAR